VADEIVLTIPRTPEFQRVAHLVLGGLAVRLDLTIEKLEDVELALDAVLGAVESADGEITVRMRLEDDALQTIVGPLSTGVLDQIEREPDGNLGLRRVLESTVDDVHVDGEWVRLTKRVESGG
jgi:anti-sigma regulatory factor (Ser/Thr protein kinase)